MKGLERTFFDISFYYIDGGIEDDDDEDEAGLFWKHVEIVHDFVVSLHTPHTHYVRQITASQLRVSKQFFISHFDYTGDGDLRKYLLTRGMVGG